MPRSALEYVEADFMVRSTEIGPLLAQNSILELGELSPFTCPECHSVLVKIKEGNLLRFRCHTGHGFTEDVLLESVMNSAGQMIWQVRRGLQKVELLLEHIGRRLQEGGDATRAKKFRARAAEIGRRASRFQKLAREHVSLSADQVEEGQPAD
jgi:two-component system chemotaxis response regulator CheB